MDIADVNRILEESPEKTAKAYKEMLQREQETKRVFAVRFLREKFDGVETPYSDGVASEMVRASNDYDKAKALEIQAQAEYKFEQERMINARKAAELIAKGL